MMVSETAGASRGITVSMLPNELLGLHPQERL
jgi:hypothetical protein